jgi:hypothetical protein
VKKAVALLEHAAGRIIVLEIGCLYKRNPLKYLGSLQDLQRPYLVIFLHETWILDQLHRTK